MKGHKMVVCEICGSVAEVPANRKIAYCNNPSCERLAKQKHTKSNEKISQEKKDDGTRMYREDEIIYVKDIIPEQDGLVVDVLDFAKKLGTLRFEGEELRKKLREEQSKSDQADQEFLHQLESIHKMTVKEALNLITQNGKSRTNRRDKKTLTVIMNTLLNGIVSNPHRYAVEAIKGGAKADVAYAMKNNIKEE